MDITNNTTTTGTPSVPAQIEVKYDSGEPQVSGRELHEKLEVGTLYKDWFPRMVEYGFAEGQDFNPLIFERVALEGGREVKRTVTDHLLTLDMAKELCMIQRTDIGKQFRLYFIQVEKEWRSSQASKNMPGDYISALEKLLEEAKARQAAEEGLAASNSQVLALTGAVAEQAAKIAEMEPKVSYLDLILQNPAIIPVTVIAKDYGYSAQAFNKLLAEPSLHIQYCKGGRWYLYADLSGFNYTQTRTTVDTAEDGETTVHIETCWTQDGRKYLYYRLKKEGILPMVERKKDEVTLFND